MDKGIVHIYSGGGRGKSSAALGRALQTAAAGKKVVIIQFLKGMEDSELLRRLEPAIKIFRFEKSDECFLNLTPERQQEEIANIKNGLNFAKKVLTTGECDLLILDEVLGLVDNGIITAEDLRMILDTKSESTSIIMTGIHLCDAICLLADEIFEIEQLKFKTW